MPETKSDRIAPVRKSITVLWQPEAAFRRFTAGMADWWPLSTHSVSESAEATCEIEGRVGGRVFETGPDGAEHLWGDGHALGAAPTGGVHLAPRTAGGHAPGGRDHVPP
jgi:hypothetical protein